MMAEKEDDVASAREALVDVIDEFAAIAGVKG